MQREAESRGELERRAMHTSNQSISGLSTARITPASPASHHLRRGPDVRDEDVHRLHMCRSGYAVFPCRSRTATPEPLQEPSIPTTSRKTSASARASMAPVEGFPGTRRRNGIQRRPSPPNAALGNFSRGCSPRRARKTHDPSGGNRYSRNAGDFSIRAWHTRAPSSGAEAKNVLSCPWRIDAVSLSRRWKWYLWILRARWKRRENAGLRRLRDSYARRVPTRSGHL